MITFADFERVDIRVGRIIRADLFPQARKPAYKLGIDFGTPIGTRQSSAQLTRHYQPAELAGRLVLAVVTSRPRQIGPFMSEALTRAYLNDRGRLSWSDPIRVCHPVESCSDDFAKGRM